MVTRFLGLVILLQVCLAGAQEVRVVSWDLERVSGQPPGGEAQLRKAANYLQQLDADVILVQSIEGWGACRQLIEFLQPKSYHVLVCSAFGGGQPEVAVLAKHAARVGWSEAWSDQASGFAFAGVPFGEKLVGFFSVRLPTGTGASSEWTKAREAACRQLLDQIDNLAQWQQNRADVWVVGGNFATSPELDEEEWTLSLLEEAGFANAYFTVGRENRVSVRGFDGAEATVDYLFVKNGAFVSPPSLLLAEGFLHRPLSCGIDPAQISAPTTWFEQVRRARAERRQIEVQARAEAASGAGWPLAGPLWPWWGAGVLALLAVGFSLWWWRLSVRLRSSRIWALTQHQAGYGIEAALPPPDSAQVLVHGEFMDTDDPDTAHWRERAEAAEKRAAQAAQLVKAGMLPGLVDWFKQTFVRRLAAQRSDLLESHHRTTHQVRVLEEQVARIQGGMQDRVKGFERRIQELERELAYAKAEKRDLITAQIRVTRDRLERARHAVPGGGSSQL